MTLSPAVGTSGSDLKWWHNTLIASGAMIAVLAIVVVVLIVVSEAIEAYYSKCVQLATLCFPATVGRDSRDSSQPVQP